MQPIGVLRLDTRFPRIYGDAGNAGSWPFPVVIRTVADATPQRVVRERADGLVDAFLAAARALAAEGVAGITTTCGFLCLHQRTIASALPVPFASSSLLQVPWLARTTASGRIGILTIDRDSLTPAHLAAVGVDGASPIEGVAPDGHLARVFLDEAITLDWNAAFADLVAAGQRLIAREPDIGALVLECANMPPYASALRSALGLPVYDWYSMVIGFASGLAPRQFVAPSIALRAESRGAAS